MAEVNKADREAAASGYFAWIGSNPVIPAKMRSGNADDHSMVQAFARHRTEATAELVEALQAADEALRYYACHGGDGVPCLRTAGQCASECGRAAGDALLTVTAALAKHLTDGPGLTERLEN